MKTNSNLSRIASLLGVGLCLLLGQRAGGECLTNTFVGSVLDITDPPPPNGGGNGYSLDITGYMNEVFCGFNSSNDFNCPTLCDCPPGMNGGGSPCSGIGMPGWSVSEPYLNLWVKDTPLGYQPSKGPGVAFSIAYKMRETVSGFSTEEFSVGRRWNSAWYSFVQPVSGGGGGYDVQFAGGGTLHYAGLGVNQFQSNTRLESSGGTYRLNFNDGSTNVYAMAGTVGGQQRYYLTEIVDRTGQKLRLEYANQGANPSVLRLLRVIDTDGRTNSLGYATSGYSTNLITSVVDGFGRTASMSYNTNGELTGVTDVAGLASSFIYATNGWMTNMITPYGTNYFSAAEANLTRSLAVTDAGGGRHLWLFDRGTLNPHRPFLQAGLVAGGQGCVNPLRILFHKNSYYWGPRQMASVSHTNDLSMLTANECRLARRKHWMENNGNYVLSMQQEFSPDGDSGGESVWFDYDSIVPTQIRPLLTMRLLPNGETSLVRAQVNAFGVVTNLISTYTMPDGSPGYRTNAMKFSADGVDLIESYDAELHRMAGIGYSNHQPVSITNALNEITRMSYNGVSQQTGIAHSSGLVLSNFYFTTGGYNGWLDRTVDYIGGVAQRTNSFTYTNGLIFTQTDERGAVTTNTWDALGRLTSVRDGLGTVTNIYNKLDLVRTVDRMGFTNGFVYDAMRRLKDSYDSLGRKTHYEYCTCGALESVTDADNKTTTLTYDAGGRNIGRYHADGYWVTNELNKLGQVVSTTDSAGASVTNAYNNQGLLYQSLNAWGNVGLTTFDIHDHVITQTDANNVTVTNAYDVAGRLLVRGTPANSAREFFGYTFNVSGLTSYTNALTNATWFSYDAYGRKVAETNANQEVNRFAYDADGALKTLTDGLNHVTTWKHDAFGRLTNKVDHLGTNVFIYGYDANSRLTSRITPAKGTTAYGYDAVGNLTNVNYPVSADLTLQYDALNRLTKMVSAGLFTINYTYTAAGQLASESGPWGYDKVSYTYANRLRTRMSLQQPFGAWAVTNVWDAATKRLTGVASGAGSFGYVFDGTRNTKHAGITLPGGGYITNVFDALARLTDTRYVSPDGATLNSHGYGLNVGNQRTSQTRMGPGYTNTMDYGYDPLGQLLSATGKEVDGSTRLHEKFGYAYDAGGNLKTRTNNALIQSFTVNEVNQLTNVTRTGTLTVSGNTSSKASDVTVSGQTASRYADLMFAKDGFTLANGSNTFTAIAQSSTGIFNTNSIAVNLPVTSAMTFDANGNMTWDGAKAFEYDDENQLVRVTQTNVFKSEFTYDGLGRMRVKKEYTWSGSWALTSETRYIYDRMLVIQERGANNAPLVSYTRGKDLSGGMQGAGGIGGMLARTDHATASVLLKTAFYHADGNGNITALLSTNGLVLAWYQYTPFGTTLAQSGPLADANVYRFSSKAWHERTGLYYYGYRFYSPNLQRWLNADPIQEEGGINLYGFVFNDSVGLVDPLGEAASDQIADPWIKQVHAGRDMLMSGGTGWGSVLWNTCVGSFATLGESIPDALKAGDATGDASADPNAGVGTWTLAVIQDGGRAATVVSTAGGAAAKVTTAVRGASGGTASAAAAQAAGAASATAKTGCAAKGTELVAQNGTKITGFTKHGIDRVVGDGSKRAGVKPEALLDALKNPKKIVSGVDSQGRPFQTFVGENARVVVNPQTGQVVSVNPLSGAGAH